MNVGRRHDDRGIDQQVDEVEEFFASLPDVIQQLKEGRRRNRRLGRIAVAIGLFVLAAFLTIAHAQERAADQDRRDAYQQCRLVNDNARTINQFLDAQIQSLRMSRLLTDSEKKQRINALVPLKQQLPVCRRP